MGLSKRTGPGEGVIHPSLLAKLDSLRAPQSLSVIVTLSSDQNWAASLDALTEAGLNVTSEERVIRAVFGHITSSVLQQLLHVDGVEWIEPDDEGLSIS